jgi:hypothetical protein
MELNRAIESLHLEISNRCVRPGTIARSNERSNAIEIPIPRKTTHSCLLLLSLLLSSCYYCNYYYYFNCRDDCRGIRRRASSQLASFPRHRPSPGGDTPSESDSRRARCEGARPARGQRRGGTWGRGGEGGNYRGHKRKQAGEINLPISAACC